MSPMFAESWQETAKTHLYLLSTDMTRATEILKSKSVRLTDDVIDVTQTCGNNPK